MKRIYFSPMLFILLVSVLLLTTFVHAATLEVGTGKPYTTIQSAINAANVGDTVLVYDGTYVERINFNGKAITVKSVNGAASTIIDGSASGTVVTFDQGEGSGSVLDGFTIKNGNGYSGGGIECYTSSSPTITNCTISGNTARSVDYYGYGGGIFCSVSSPTITNCTITGNTADYGGGIECYLSSSPTITNCTITGNTATNGGGIWCQESSPTITNCTITGNTATNSGGGIECYLSSSPTITDCTITGNTATNGGGGIECDWYSSPTINNSTISENTAAYAGGILCYSYSSPTITNCTITGNTVTEYGGGIYCNASSPFITNCTITGNTATRGAGIECYLSPSPVITNCTITGNTATESGGGIYCKSSSSPTVKNTVLWGDTAPYGKEIYLNGSTITVTYSDVEGGWAGTGNINADPLFVGNGDYHLKAGSPCIDKGTSEGAPSVDIDGDTRPQGNGYDIGADEFVGYSISGTVTLNSSGLNGVTITLSGTSSGSTTTDASGNYSFTVSNGTYTITPSKTGYTFNPPNSQVTINNANVTGQNFTAVAVPTYSISGTVSGDVQAGVTVALSGASSGSMTTDVSGNYSFIGLSNGTYTVTPSKAPYTFSPTSSLVTINGANVIGVNFTASATIYSISGTVTSSGKGLSGVTMITLSGIVSGSTTTDASGNYTFSGLSKGTHYITPSKLGYTFSPSSRTVEITGSNITGVDFVASKSSEPLDNWHLKNSPTTDPLNGIAYGNDLFVAIGEYGDIYTSSDLINWTERFNSDEDDFLDITYGKGRFVVVGEDGDGYAAVYYSLDGIEWHIGFCSGPGTAWTLRSVTYGEEIPYSFVAVGDGTIISSNDGSAWVEWDYEDFGSDKDYLYDVTYGNGTFIAVGNCNWYSIILTSSDGENWNRYTRDVYLGFRAITYGNGLFVAIAYNLDYDYKIVTSSDGINWIERLEVDQSEYLRDVTYGNNTFVSVGGSVKLQGTSYGRILSSSDGINWIRRYPGENIDDLDDVIYGDNTFVAVGRFEGWDSFILQSDPLSIPECSIWTDVIAKYNSYVGAQAEWDDVITCYNQYASP